MMMKYKLVMLTVLAATGLLVACRAIKINLAIPDPEVFPTATSHFLLRGTAAFVTPAAPVTPGALPTVANIFLVQPSPTPTQVKIATPTAEDNEDQILPRDFYPVKLYQDSLNPNWKIQADNGIQVDTHATKSIYQGRSAISLTSQVEERSIYLTVSKQSKEAYPRDRMWELSFWLYSEDQQLRLDQFFVTIAGSNILPYWTPDDHSVTVSDKLPVFPETGLDEVDFNRAVPANTWVLVELEFDEVLVLDPDYKYITGIYLETSAGFSGTIMVDEITLLMLEPGPETRIVEATPSPTPDLRQIIKVQIDTQKAVHPISELIYGVSGAPADYLQALRPALNSWGGNPSTRYNWQIGNASNAGRDYNYQNSNYGVANGSASDDFISQSMAAGAEVRLSLPTLGWVAKDDNNDTCSFPLPSGGCGDADGASCEDPGLVADANLANVPSYPSSITSWMLHLVREKEFNIRFLAVDNEPELWGITHYDVHPRCTTYNEILKQYLTYTAAVHKVAPQAELVGPVTSSWYYYWNSAAGEADKLLHANRDFLPWFLRQVQQNDRETGWRSLHGLDIHYYPEGVYNDNVDDKTAAQRLRSTRSLWDEDYVDESWINEPVYLIPRMKALIEAHYPGTKLGLSEWNWGADETMNGALAIADVLGIFGREDLYYAAYWQYPPLDSPGFYAFKLYTNFDGHGSRFGDTSVSAQSDDVDTLGSYAALDSASGDLHVMLVNKQVDEIFAKIDLGGFTPGESATMYHYDETHPEGISESTIDVAAGDFSVNLPAYSITLLVIKPDADQ
jgi:hypothetical protein